MAGVVELLAAALIDRKASRVCSVPGMSEVALEAHQLVAYILRAVRHDHVPPAVPYLQIKTKQIQ